VLHIHVAIPINILALHLQIQMFINYLQSLLVPGDSKPNVYPADIEQRNFQNTISSVEMLSFSKISRFIGKIKFHLGHPPKC
jgi:hypothetical protein